VCIRILPELKALAQHQASAQIKAFQQ